MYLQMSYYRFTELYYPSYVDRFNNYTDATISEIEDFFNDPELTITPYSGLESDDFFDETMQHLSVDDLVNYGFTAEQVKAAHESTSTDWYRFSKENPHVSAKDALAAQNEQAFAKLSSEYVIFGWTKDGELAVIE